jgi:carbamoyl-phosphate synthase/aspartate carbamoyltransferase
MKSVGEVMAIGKTFEETIQKAIRSVEYSFIGFSEMDEFSQDQLDEELANPSDQRLFAVAKALHCGYTVDRIWELSRIDHWFLNRLKNIVDFDKSMASLTLQTLTDATLRKAKKLGFSDRQVARALSTTELLVRKTRKERGITPFVKQIDTVAAEFPCFTNYLYWTYHACEHDITFGDQGVMVLGSGVYRIGSSVEFDWCAVRCIRTLRSSGYKTIMVNYNPETVSTDYDEADRLYFENLTLETVLDIYEVENSAGVVVSMGGQTPNNIALSLHRQNVKILGTSPEMIDGAENRYKFSRMLDKIEVDQPQWKELTSNGEAADFCKKVGFPVLVRPSYVLSGAAMNVVYSENDLVNYLDMAVKVSQEYPVVISKFIEEAKEIEMDAVALNGKMVAHVISEHVENAGVHSGDATLVLPPQDLDPETVKKIEEATRKIGEALDVTGPYNIQFIAKNNEIKVIECNVRASRSFPFVSKVLGTDMIEIATKAIMGLPFEVPEVVVPKNYVAVKVPQFSFSRLSGADPVLGVEMASTGEVACFGKDKYEAYLKALIATGFQVPEKNILLSIGSYKEKVELLPSVEKLHQMGFKIFATPGTADFMEEHNIPVKVLEALDEDAQVDEHKLEYSLTQHLANNLIDLYVNLPSKNRYRRPASYMSRGYRSRRMAVDFDVPLITNIKCAKLFVEALSRKTEFVISPVDYKTSHRIITMPGLVNVQSYFGDITLPSADFNSMSKASVAAGFTMSCVMPFGGLESVSDKRAFDIARRHCLSQSYGDYSLSIAAGDRNQAQLASVIGDAWSIYMNFDNSIPSYLGSLGSVSDHLKTWPADGVVITNAKGTNLASALFIANLHDRAIHVTNLMNREDVKLVALSKEKGVQVTCDVNIYNMFFSTEDFASAHLGSPEDVAELWRNLNIIDCFSVGVVPAQVAHSLGHASTSSFGLEESLPLLLTAVDDGRLTMDAVIDKLHTKPKSIFGLPEQPGTYIEVIHTLNY